MSRLRNTVIALVAASSALVGSAAVAAPAAAAPPAEAGSGGDYCWTVVDTGYTGCFLTQAARDQAVQGNFMETTNDVPNTGGPFNDKVSSL